MSYTLGKLREADGCLEQSNIVGARRVLAELIQKYERLLDAQDMNQVQYELQHNLESEA